MLWLQALIKTIILTQKSAATKFGFPTTTRIILLASPQQKTPWPVFQDGRCNISPILLILQCYHCLFQKKFIPFMPHLAITIWFQVLFHTPTGVLFSFPSRYFYAIGLKMYLELGVDASQIQTRYPTDPTQEKNKKIKFSYFRKMQKKLIIKIFTGLSPSTVLKFQIKFNTFKK